MFRHRKFTSIPVVPRPIMDEVQVEKVDENGVITVNFVERPNSVLESELPNCSDYQLSGLLAANVPLQPVNSQVLDAVPTDAQLDAAMTDLERMDNDSVKESGFFQNFSND